MVASTAAAFAFVVVVVVVNIAMLDVFIGLEMHCLLIRYSINDIWKFLTFK